MLVKLRACDATDARMGAECRLAMHSLRMLALPCIASAARRPRWPRQARCGRVFAAASCRLAIKL